MLLLLEEKLEGKVIITDKEFEDYQKWKNRRGIVKEWLEGLTREIKEGKGRLIEELAE